MQRPLTLEEVTGAIRAFKVQVESSSHRPQQHKVCFPLHNKTSWLSGEDRVHDISACLDTLSNNRVLFSLVVFMINVQVCHQRVSSSAFDHLLIFVL